MVPEGQSQAGGGGSDIGDSYSGGDRKRPFDGQPEGRKRRGAREKPGNEMASGDRANCELVDGETTVKHAKRVCLRHVPMLESEKERNPTGIGSGESR